MKTPPIVLPQEWEAARQQLLVKEKALTRARDALAAERRRMPWLAVKKKYEFDGPKGKAGLLPRPDCARAPRGVGGLAGGLPPDPAVRVVDLARRIP
jgi:hypothetical protein